MKRQAVTDRMKIDSLVHWGKIVCTNCCIRFNKLSEVEWDHIHPLALGGAHDAPNIVPLCKPCHKLKTFGTKATSCGSDIHEIAKAKRLANPKPSRHPMPKTHRKIPSRPWPKR